MAFYDIGDILSFLRRLTCKNCKSPSPVVGKLKLHILNEFCCDFDNTAKLEIPVPCCSRRDPYIVLKSICCNNNSGNGVVPNLTLLKQCCFNRDVALNILQTCCANPLFIFMDSNCCEPNIPKIRIEDICCGNNAGNVTVSISNKCCSH